MFSRLLSTGFAVLGIAILLPSTSLGQPNRGGMIKTPPISGTVAAVSGNQLQVSTRGNQTIYVMVPTNAEVSVTGTADKDYLKSKGKILVEFTAEISKGEKGGYVAKDKIDSLTIVSPDSDRPIGLYPGEATPKKKKGDKGAKTDNAAANLFGDGGGKANKSADPFGDSGSGKPAKKKNNALQFPGTYTARGTVKLGLNGLMTVSTGRWTIKATLADDATIDVDVADMSVVQHDDKVTVEGFAARTQPNRVMAESVKVELANPLTGAKKHGTHPSKTPATKPKKGDSPEDVFGK